MSDAALRSQLARALEWEDAHVGFDRAVEGVPAELRGRVPDGLPYSAWQLLEHLRLAQEDILDFCRNPGYAQRDWPDDYWPATPAPATPRAWDDSVAAFRRDRQALARLAADAQVDLFAPIPHGSGQTLLRELLLVLDHTAYHLGGIRQALARHR